ncbi:hypothetical protein L6164_029710 [Bauhinia variegata]|uniref:Uncharacterized protein n=1 Tax=Bauhinia variegata TaxID=167791 RepID=A0ACB9LBF2_BAUVA|nr:hypothetical protein L6164_029710 [Bauhinia variegata]
MGGLIDLNTTEDDETPSSGSSASSSSNSGLSTSVSASALAVASSSVCLELWHACAGPMISSPKKGSVVVYYPQGHFEQVQGFSVTAYNIPTHVFCRVVDVKLHAEEGSDEVYCQVTLVPESEHVERKLRKGSVDADGEEEDAEDMVKSTTPHMFCKTLTASDTSTHGGFSVPRRAAEDCFPPLDYSLQRPSQELVAKDLHGLEWKFRHIYRGQPRRHLLTTGWSAFVNKKKLVSGDAVLFLRGEDGELRLGIRRAVQLKGGGTFSTPTGQQLNPSTLIDVVNALNVRCAFSVCYNPRASSSDFIIPLHKFLKSLDHSYSVGMRFRMRFESEDPGERGCNGLIVGISDVDPVRWPGSKWRCLMVRWDDMEGSRHNRVSPWEIEPTGSASTSSNLMVTGLKRTRIGLPSAKLEFPVPNGIGTSDYGESLRFRKVLQGSNCSGIAAPVNGMRFPRVNSDNGIDVSESFQMQVLQGQEILPSQPYGRVLSVDEAQGNGRCGIFDGFQLLGPRNRWSAQMQDSAALLHPPAPSGQVSSPSSVLMFQQAVSPASNCDSIYNINGTQNMGGKTHFQGSHTSEVNCSKFTLSPRYEPTFGGNVKEGINSFGMLNLHNHVGASESHDSVSPLRGSEELVSSCKSSCRLFGFSLTEESHDANRDTDPITITHELNSGASFTRHVGDKFHPESSLRGKAVGSNYVKGVLQF